MQSVRNNPRLFTFSLPIEPEPSASRQPATPAPEPATPTRTARLFSPGRGKVPLSLQGKLAAAHPAPTPPDTPAKVVANQFATRPTVRSVVAKLLDDALKIDSANTALAGSSPDRPTPLLDLALEHLANGAELDFSGPRQWVKSDTGSPAPLDSHSLELAIRSLRPNLKPAYAEALSQYWGQPAFGATSRWLWLSDTLKNTLRIAGLQQPGLDPQQRETLDQITRYPDAGERNTLYGAGAAKVFRVDTTLTHQGTASTVSSPDLLITRQVGERTLVLHATAQGVVTPYTSLEAFATAWERQLSARFTFDHLTWKRTESDGTVFDTQAAIMLDQQLQNLDAIQLPAKTNVTNLEQVFTQASDTSHWFSDTASAARLEQMQRKMPPWLTQASDADRFTYQRQTLALASSVQRHQGRSFLTDIPDLRTYAEQQLNAHLAPKGYTAKDLEITFNVPVGDLGSGYIEPIKMNLVDMALENLAGLPKGAMEIRLRGQRVNDVQMPQRLKDLISSVDIGQHYPALLNQQLLSDTEQARQRSALFTEQVPVQLALQALELKLKGEAGVTDGGYRLVEAVTRPGSGPRTVDGQPVTVRPLAFLHKPGATPDVVANMFLLEPKDPTRGPHLLYRPLLAPPLLEFASRDALLAAVQAPGPLQHSILAWLPDDKTRAIYANDGFKTPHITHYSLFNEFDAPDTPAPTALAVDGYAAAEALDKALLDGQLMQHLFSTNARSLVTLAEGQSVSDAQSRWASHKELGWLLFNTLLPVLRGPGAMAGWLVQLASVENDIKQASDPSHPDPAQALVDLLVNVSTLLSHTHTAPERPVGHLPFAQRPDVSIALRRTAGEPSSAPAVVTQDTTMTGDGLADSHHPFDFAFSSPRQLSPAQRALIDSFSVPGPTTPEPPISSGETEGLYLIDNKLHARIENRWFRVARDLDGVFVIDEQDKARTGPPLTRDAQRLWQFDIRPKLKGGMPKSSARMKATLERNNALSEAKLATYVNEVFRMKPAVSAMETAGKRVKETQEALQTSGKTLKTLWSLANHGERKADFTARYQQERMKNQGLDALLRLRLEDYQKSVDTLIAHRKHAIQVLTAETPAQDFNVFKEKRAEEYQAIAETLRANTTDYLYVGDELSHAISGEPLTSLIERTRNNEPGAYAEFIDSLAHRVERLTRLIKANEAYNQALDEWKNDSPASKKQAEAFIKATRQPPAGQPFNANLERLSALRELSIDRSVDTQSPEVAFFLARFNRADLNSVATSHIELQQHEGYTTDERIAVLSHLIDQYRAELTNTQALQDVDPVSVRPVYGKLFVDYLQGVIDQAQAELADLIREEQHLPPVAGARQERPRKSNNKRVFKTRDKQTLVGTLRAAQAGQDIPIIDVLDSRNGQALTSYSWHPAEGEWVQIVRAEPIKPAPVPSPKPLSALIGNARKLMDEQAGIERSIQFQKKKLDDPTRRESVNPSDWSDMLEAQAQRLEQVAQEAQAGHGARSETAAWVQQWQDAAKEMRRRAIAHRCDGYLRQAPRAQNVEYLWTHGRVDIGLVNRGKKLKGGDFLTEYAVREKNGPKVLWYAHFHYPTPTTPRADHSAAHLKIPEQRFLTQQDLINQAGQDNKRIESIVRSQIKAPLDEKLFLKL
ncbi:MULTISPECIES: hypothetical protein [unclassified Pseudomonas]|uniref:Uncharacterized protein n=2 Tax=Pseudomonas TaxID=286 RepID=A0ACA7P8L2_9PSED|nr:MULTISPECIES: hypothetical protein [unclassified Pseudomonas]AHC36271.1 hypothetical protein U771_18770 [Pseudomonas sp. TKP]SDZ62947.1 hypothetical protein SAMN05444743_12414 [Pseudomonas sp. PDC86]